MAASIKKKWLTPEIKIIDRNPLQAKNFPNVRESTGHYVTLNSLGYKAFLNAANTQAFQLYFNSNPVGHKNDLIS